MTHDLVIRNGKVVDGTGAEPVDADVAIDGDRITTVGEVDGRGRRELDAEGQLVTPGFVDIHTHLDAQLAWDPIGSSSCWHGVTSVVLGNCGVTFAPCKPADRRFLAEMMESVEDIPADSIMDGLAWDWESYGEYLGAVDRMPKGVNAGGMVGHCAVRIHAMGERALDEAPATEADVDAMRALVAEAIDAGALGFSTSRTALHRVPDGRVVPGTHADPRELLALAEVMGERKRGVFEAALALGERGPDGDRRTQGEVAMLGELSRRTGRPATFGLSQTKKVPGIDTDALETVEQQNGLGADLRPQTTARGIGLLFGPACRTPFDGAPAWRALRDLTVAETVAVLRDPERRAELVRATEGLPTIPMEELYVLPEGDARYDLGPEDTLAAEAGRRGVSPAEAFAQLVDERNGDVLVNWPFLNDDLGAVEGMLRHPDSVLGLADAGAHVGMIMDSSQPTFFLTYWIRDRGLSSIGEAIRRLTSDTAELFGVTDRGVLRPGAFADVNVIDLDGMRLPQPEYVHDFPRGAGRYVQRASGYTATVVNGEVFMQDGEHTGALAGRLLRS
ncbi:MAG TPA: amidohydrolase family protein [Acidimicrobiia bacterium]|jgi:N-acyl-D-aspartate/D-glutamate deacylase